ncbi:hypothetical protein DPMN_134450 [Dreissena polymorpha]|uniref:Uncharacterized protein n=1 Tax=Dreissena polymorpha TaxID=45954 RepID=A0A9D4JBX0_DREPO|nr:hypothetical protein DPMN_134450 [Dreissena polymorpha]
MQFAGLNERMDLLENGLEQEISSKVAQLLDKRVLTEISKIRKEVEVIIDNVKRDIHAEVAAEIENINDQLKEVSTNCGSAKMINFDDNFVIRNIPESTSEGTVNKINALNKDGLKVTGVVCEKAERKKNRDSTKPGVAIARFKSHGDKRKIMQQKSTLDINQQYRDLFIYRDVSLSERRMWCWISN